MAKESDLRKCVLTGVVKPKEDLLRFVLLRDGTVIPDFNKKIEGHGFYISNSKRLLQELMVKNPLNKILHTKTIINNDLVEIVEQILCKKGLETINLARKAGSLIQGFEKVKDIIAKGKASFVIQAIDAGDDGKHKITEMAKNIEIFTVYDVATLSKALNRENTVYLVLLQNPMSKTVRLALKRYQAFLND